jgi:hypothetical protein
MYIYLILILLALSLFYVLRKMFRYTVKLVTLKSLLKDYNSDKIKITFLRKLRHIAFGPRGQTDFIIETPKKRYAVSVISFLLENGRWNIEKTRHSYYVEARRRNDIFYRVEKNSGTEPEFARDYRRESRFQRSELHLSTEKSESEKRILLIYPCPRALTYTDSEIHYLNPGDRIEDYEIMYADELIALLEKLETAK